ncbi:WxL domain-containing protein [Carnobacterium maltaromaticum]|uniref:WxL domain-containing protein n=1 Tax=Carnobacterium maltaromaticum TaxID=2751 RepID=A0AAW9JT42_CARML|nr:WxL domain-containing protein [Carnobacterium maltaromaticum]MDZ5759995.1 WxL domain-containing protein [Carnobacterium maltaromaticum]
MKKLTAIIMVTLLSGSILISTYSASAAVANTEFSTNSVDFVAGDEAVDPLDPTNPDNPTPPVPLDPMDPENPGTGNVGTLTINYVSNIKFGQQKISGKDITYNALNADPDVQVTDLRGTGAGWNLSAKTNGFASADGKKVLKSAELSFKNGEVKAGSKNNVSLVPVASNMIFNNNSIQTVMNAKKDAGKGTWLNVWSGKDQSNDKVQLKVLAGTAEANTAYTSTITWELADAPK